MSAKSNLKTLREESQAWKYRTNYECFDGGECRATDRSECDEKCRRLKSYVERIARCEELLDAMDMIINSANKQSDAIAARHLKAAIDKCKGA